MKKLYDRSKKNDFIILFVLIVIAALFIYKEFIFCGKLIIYGDTGSDTFDSYWPTYALIEQIIKGKFSFWTFKIGLGTSIFSLSMFLFDPFNVFYIFANRATVPNFMLLTNILKIISSGLLFLLYIKSFRVSRFSAIVSSFLYAFNGFLVLWGQHSFFSLIIVYSPLVLWAFERWLREDKWLPFVISICLVMVYSYYFSYMLSIFLLFYCIARYIIERKFEIKSFLTFSLKTAFYYLLGVLLGAALIFPTIYAVAVSPRTEGSLFRYPIFSHAGLKEYVSILSRMFSNDLLGTAESYAGAINYYESPIIYCGVLTILLIPQAFMLLSKKEKLAYGTVLTIFSVFILIPYGSIIMNAFTALRYRWTFVIIIFELLLLALTINKIESKGGLVINILRKNILAYLLILAGLFLYKFTHTFIKEIYKGTVNLSELTNQLIEHFANISFFQAFGIFATVLTFLVLYYVILSRRSLNNRLTKIVLILVILAETIMFSHISVANRLTVDKSYITNKQGYFDNTNKALNYLGKVDKSFYRIDKDYYSRFLNDSMIQEYYGTKSYCSLNQVSYVNFVKALGIEVVHPNIITGFTDKAEVQSLIGVKYLLSKNANVSLKGFSFFDRIEDINIYKNNYCLPLGFAYDRYIARSEFDKISKDVKGRALLRSVVLEDKIELPPSLSIPVVTDVHNLIDKEVSKAEIEKFDDESVNITSFNEDYIVGEINLMDSKFVFLSVPHDKGWSLSVDGKKVSIFKANVGFLGTLIEKGEHTIELKYTPPFAFIGILVSIGSFIIIIVLLLLRKK